MSRPRMAAAAALTATMAICFPAAAQELDPQITTLTRATPVAAYGNTVAWSERNAQTGRYRLMLLRGSRWGRVRVAERSIPFDVDVGPGPDGVTVSYSRCNFEPPERFRAGLSVLPDYTRGRECRMYRYDVRAKRELAVAGSRHGVLPSVYKGRVAYVKPGTRRLLEAATIGGSRLRARGAGPRGTHATWLDLGSGRRLASLWQGDNRSRLRFDGKLVGRVAAPARLLGMGWDAGTLYFRSTCVRSASGCPEAYWALRPRSMARYRAFDSADLVAAAHGGGTTYALLGYDGGQSIGCSDEQACRLVIEDTLTFKRVTD